MATVNKQIIIGRLGKDPEVKQGQNQTQDSNGQPRSNSYCFVGVATDHRVKQPDGTWKNETTWHNVNAYGVQAEHLGKYGKKGSLVYIEGRTQHKKDEKTGGYFTNVIASHVVVLERESTSGQKTEQDAGQTEQVDRGVARAIATHTGPPQVQSGTAQPELVAVGAESDSDLPF
jgi:single-strand DNA-binding protein